MIAATLAIAAPMLAACAPEFTLAQYDALPASGCPTVYRVRGNGPSTNPAHINILFVPVGFAEGDLPKFRCAVNLLTAKLMSESPFAEYDCNTTVWRMDLASPTSGIDPIPNLATTCAQAVSCQRSDIDIAACANDAVLSDPGSATIIDPAWAPGPTCLAADLGVRLCGYDNEYCNLLRPDETGEAKLVALARCVPQPVSIVLLANSGVKTGGGTLYPPLAVATLLNINDTQAIDDLLAHEIGHTWGLFDEYVTGPPGMTYAKGRNLAKYDSNTGTLDEVSWTPLCRNPTGTDCQFVRGQTCSTVPSGFNESASGSRTGALVGLWEGAYSFACGYYRAKSECRLNDQMDYPYCDACLAYVDTVHGTNGIQRCMQPFALERPGEVEIWRADARIVVAAGILGRRLQPVRPPPTPCEGLDCRVHAFRPDQVEAIRALVTLDGIEGEIDVERVRIRFDPVPGFPRALVAEGRVRREGLDRFFTWTIDGRSVTPEDASRASGWVAEALTPPAPPGPDRAARAERVQRRVTRPIEVVDARGERYLVDRVRIVPAARLPDRDR